MYAKQTLHTYAEFSVSWKNLAVGYKSQVRSDPPIIFRPIINFIFVIISNYDTDVLYFSFILSYDIIRFFPFVY